MPRKAPDAAPPAPPFVIDPDGVYLPDQVRHALKLRASSLRREIREGRLKVSKRCGRYYFLGEQLLAWLRGGELPTARTASANGHAQHRPA